MAFTTEYEKEGILFSMSDDVTVTDMIRLDDTLYTNENFSSLKYLIIDYTTATSFEMSEEDVKYVAEQDMLAADRNPNLVIVAISTDVHLIDSLILYDTYKGGHPWKSTLASSMGEARKWIEQNKI